MQTTLPHSLFKANVDKDFPSFTMELKGINTRLTNINKFKISDFVISTQKRLKPVIMGHQQIVKSKISTTRFRRDNFQPAIS